MGPRAPGERSGSGGIPPYVPPAVALGEISLAADDARATAPQAAEVASDPRPAWPVSRRHGRELGAEDAPAASVASSGIVPGAAGSAEGADPAGDPPLFLEDASESVLTWARRRHLGLSPATGISVALACCAAAWFSAGTTADTARGVAALWCSYLVLVAGHSVDRTAAKADADHRVAGPVRWLAALGVSVGETAVYAGLAVGAAAERYAGAWALGTGVVALVAVRNLMTASSTPYGLVHPPETRLGQICAATVTMTPGGRILVVGFVAPFWGARTVLLVLLAWAISTVGYGLAGRSAPDRVAEAPGAGDGSAVASQTVVRLRDDGILARYLGALVRGVLLPLPPAVLGLAGVTALAVLGLHGLPGPLLMAPAVVMLLAAPGSGNPHLGRLDWLVPVLLLSSQLLYVGAVGAGARVPGPIVFALTAALLVRYTDLICGQRPVLLVKPRRRGGAPREYGTDLGWEGRLLFVGIAAAVGAATAGYLVLTAYLVLLIGAKVVRSGIISSDEDLE